jgi:hypothetical protein
MTPSLPVRAWRNVMNFDTVFPLWMLFKDSDFCEQQSKLLWNVSLSFIREQKNIPKEAKFVLEWIIEDIIRKLPCLKEVVGKTHVYNIAVFFDGELETGRSFEGRLDSMEEYAEERKTFKRGDNTE